MLLIQLGVRSEVQTLLAMNMVMEYLSQEYSDISCIH
jgi:hypothetical protein